ncbi:Small-conductance mechanosensitive channel [Aquimixticola soesokkakensis]|uniref:Small-conductance mechanosensitive channel n=1 Tax=Aquimixticola soesokkakensis TaxID=1519096 RepID=A0A1Y5RFP4_9RHOB|nr:mechanosensitive ion channel family protein [Aquimixticola soesokkakensis]SLN16465.1 Small-conductance mechanosensitive channel [Aquimixticola soesokkakensis]
MEELNNLISTPIWNGNSLGDYLTIDFLAGVLGSFLGAVFILVVGFTLAGWANRRLSTLPQKNERFDPTLFDFLGNILRYAIIAFTLLFVLNTFGVQTTSVVAVIGAAGLAIGLALQGTLSNVAAGVMIVFFRPIKQGDFVVIGGQMGTVKHISLNFTELANLANVQIIIPNSEVWGNTITNYSVNNTRRVEWTFGVGYGTNLKKAEDIIRATIMGDPRAHTDPEPFIQVNNLGDSSVDFLVRVWCANSDAFAFQCDMTRAVKEAFDAGDIDIPFPNVTVSYLDEGEAPTDTKPANTNVKGLDGDDDNDEAHVG